MTLVAVTGINGMIGRRVAEQLTMRGIKVRALLRRDMPMAQGVEVVIGDLTSEEALRHLVDGVDIVFHCAAELYDESAMHEVNVIATERLGQMAIDYDVTCFIHISSAGVVGAVHQRLIDETTLCQPRNFYERSKWQSEQVLAHLPENGVRLCMLRPINVIDDERPGILNMILRDTWKDRIQFFIKGGEMAHVVHAYDVAAAALHLAFSPLRLEGAFFVGCDEDAANTIAGVLKLCIRNLGSNRVVGLHLPVCIPYFLRRMIFKTGLHGATIFSSARLIATGFKYPLGLDEAIKRICLGWRSRG